MIELFENNDAAFHKWMAANPTGFVLNIRKKFDNYMVIHRANCSSFKGGSPYYDNPHTGQRYRKICSSFPQDIDDYVVEQQNVFGKKEELAPGCKKCNPEFPN